MTINNIYGVIKWQKNYNENDNFAFAYLKIKKQKIETGFDSNIIQRLNIWKNSVLHLLNAD